MTNNNGTLNIENLNQILKQNCFDLFGITKTYKIDQDSLKDTYNTLQKKFHPDNFINHPQSQLSVLVCAHINNAYNTLKSPLLRSIELLKHKNINLDLSTNTSLPGQFLSEQMELHEEIEDAGQNIDTLTHIITEITDKEHKLIEEIDQNFAQENYDLVVDYTKQLSFYNKLKNLINIKIEELW